MHGQPFPKVFLLLFFFLFLPFAYHEGVALHSAPLVDLPSFYYAAQTTFAHGQSPYPPQALAWGAASVHQIVWPFLYPPPALLLFAPFAHMSYHAAKLLTLAASHVCILVLLALLLQILGLMPLFKQSVGPETHAGDNARRGFVALFVLVYFFAFHPLISTLMTGQINFYVIVCLCLTWIALKRDLPPGWTALPLMLAIALKTYPLLLLPLLLIKGRGRVVAWTAGYLAALLAASFVVLPHVVWHDWLAYVAPYGAYSKSPVGLFPVYDVWNQSINGFIARLFLSPQTAIVYSPLAARVVPALLAAGVVGTEWVLSWRLRAVLRAQGQHKEQGLNWEFGLFLLTMFLVAPLSWDHHLVFVLPALCVAWNQILLFGAAGRTKLCVGAAAFILAWPIPVDAAVLDMHTFHLLLSLKFYAVAALWVYFAVRVCRLGVPIPVSSAHRAPINASGLHSLPAALTTNTP